MVVQSRRDDQIFFANLSIRHLDAEAMGSGLERNRQGRTPDLHTIDLDDRPWMGIQPKQDRLDVIRAHRAHGRPDGANPNSSLDRGCAERDERGRHRQSASHTEMGRAAPPVDELSGGLRDRLGTSREPSASSRDVDLEPTSPEPALRLRECGKADRK
jgi:hypothetical protein